MGMAPLALYQIHWMDQRVVLLAACVRVMPAFAGEGRYFVLVPPGSIQPEQLPGESSPTTVRIHAC